MEVDDLERGSGSGIEYWVLWFRGVNRGPSDTLESAGGTDPLFSRSGIEGLDIVTGTSKKIQILRGISDFCEDISTVAFLLFENLLEDWKCPVPLIVPSLFSPSSVRCRMR